MKATKERDSVVKRTDNKSDYEKMRPTLSQSQVDAADELIKLANNSHFGVPAMDPSKEPVDGGKIAFEIPDHVIDSQNKLGRACSYVGFWSYTIAYNMIVYEVSSRKLAQIYDEDSDNGAKGMRKRVSQTLTELADHWGMSRTDHRRSSYFSRDFIPPKLVPDACE